MKHFITDNIILVLFALLAAAGCTREELAPAPAGDFVAPSEFEIGWEYGDVVNIDTRTEQSVTVENRVTNLYVLLAAANGKIIHRKSYWVTRDSQIPDGYDNIITAYSEKTSADGEASRGTIPEFFTEDNNNTDFNMSPYSDRGPFIFYAVANYSDAVSQELESVNTDADLEALTSRFTTEGNVNRTRFLMTAKESGINLNIDDEGKIERVGVNLDLKRVDAKIKFNLTVDIEEAVDGTVLFDNMAYRVHRVPDVTFLFPKEKGEGDGQEWDAAAIEEAEPSGSGYSCMLDDNYQTFDTTRVDGGTFAFYLRENRPNPKKRITPEEQGDWFTLYAMREAWPGGEENPVDDVSNRVPVHGRQFTYAPENATFVEISGDLSYTRTTAGGESEEVFGSVTYIVHLGETGNAPNDEEAVNNYDVRRNVSYIYNMRITGINNFVVEVTEGEERRPGAEGDITVSSNRQVTMDAHYGRVLLELDRTSIEQGASWSVRTPIGEVRYNVDTGLINAPYDYKWVLFAVNADFGVSSDRMVKFPGVQAYDGGVQFFEDMTDDELKKAIANDRGNHISYRDTTYTFKDYIESHDLDNYWYDYRRDLTEHACLLDVNQLVHYLEWSLRNNNQTIFDEDGKVAVTAFCDEYTYIYDPRIEDYIHPGQSVANMGDKDRRLLLWKYYVDADSRVMNITPMATTEYSPDGNTSLTNSYITISQNSIKTIYNPDNTNTAWGLETTNETGKLTHVTSTGIDTDNSLEHGERTNTLSDGRTNFLNFWVEGNDNYNAQGKIRWTAAMTVSKDVENGNDLSKDYRNALYACITRNRDLNGNDIIDADEIYWYLAARDQLTGLWIGQGALDDEAWMYNGDGTEPNHFVTSSHRNEGGQYWILWAEEGASLGGLRISGDDKYNDSQGEALPYDYRCVRNLGIDIAEEEAPQHFAEISNRFNNGNLNYYTIDVSVINSRALRSSPDDGINLPFDNERSQNNTPFISFDVRTENDRYEMNWIEMRDNINNNINPCPSGWRVPNQREFLIMMSFGNNLRLGTGYYDDLAIATSFSFCGVAPFADNRYGFYYDSGNLRLAEGNPSPIKIRCVRDHTGN